MFHLLQEQYTPDLILLQEAVINASTHEYLSHYTYENATNIQSWKKSFGVLTAAKSPLHKQLSLKTMHRELHIATKKSLLITSHSFDNDTTLTVVNLHAINFVPASIFIKEIDQLLLELSKIQGSLIVAGDFNTWNKKRLRHIEAFANSIGLIPAILEDSHHIKHLFSKPLDHLFYRGVALLEAKAIDTQKVSDHNPIFARFEL